MLDNSYTNRENAIEEVVYDFLKGCQRVELSEEATQMFIEIGMMPKNMKLLNQHKPQVFQIIEKRMEYVFTFKVTDERVFLIITLLSQTAGFAMLYLWYIQAWCFKNNIQEVDFETFGIKIFPLGVFSEKDLQSAWDNQKVKRNDMQQSDDLIDYKIAGLSIQFLK
jgi:hypothetical protein